MNVTALLNTDGSVVERYAYDPYGRPTFYDGNWENESSTSSYANAILYCGYYHDTETGLYHVRHRSYHPALGRWMQREPSGYKDGLSFYEFLKSAPAVSLDPDGRKTWRESSTMASKGIQGGYFMSYALEKTYECYNGEVYPHAAKIVGHQLKHYLFGPTPDEQEAMVFIVGLKVEDKVEIIDEVETDRQKIETADCCGEERTFKVQIQWSRAMYKTIGLGALNISVSVYSEFAGKKILGEQVRYIKCICCEEKGEGQGASGGTPRIWVM